MKQFNVGTALVDVVHRAVRCNTLTHSKAGALLGSKPGAVEPFLRQFEDKRRSFRSSEKSKPLSSDTFDLVAAAKRCMQAAWPKDEAKAYGFTKVGILLDDLVQFEDRPLTLFDVD